MRLYLWHDLYLRHDLYLHHDFVSTSQFPFLSILLFVGDIVSPCVSLHNAACCTVLLCPGLPHGWHPSCAPHAAPPMLCPGLPHGLPCPIAGPCPTEARPSPCGVGPSASPRSALGCGTCDTLTMLAREGGGVAPKPGWLPAPRLPWPAMAPTSQTAMAPTSQTAMAPTSQTAMAPTSQTAIWGKATLLSHLYSY